MFILYVRFDYTHIDINTLAQGIKSFLAGASCSSVVRAFAHGAMGRRIDPSWDGPIEPFLAPRLA